MDTLLKCIVTHRAQSIVDRLAERVSEAHTIQPTERRCSHKLSMQALARYESWCKAVRQLKPQAGVQVSTQRGSALRMSAQSSVVEHYPHGLVSLSKASTMADNLKRLGSVSMVEFEVSKFIQPQTVLYDLDGKGRRWCVMHTTSMSAGRVVAQAVVCAHSNACLQSFEMR